MGILILIFIVLAVGIWIGFIIGFSKAMREAAARLVKPNNTIAQLMFPVSGAILLLVASGFTIHSIYFIHTAGRTNGKVVELREHHDKDNDTTYSPVVSFQDPNGTEHFVESQSSSSPPAYHVGETVSLLYRKQSPADASIDSFIEIWGGAIITSAMGLVFLLVGLLQFYWPRIKQQFWPFAKNAPANQA